MRPRILHIIKVKGVSGAENHLLTLLPQLTGEFDVSMVFLVEPGNAMTDFSGAFKAQGIPVTRIDMNHHLDLSVVWKIYYLIRKTNPHIVHTHLLHGDLYGITAAVFTGTRILVSTKHGYDNYDDTSFFYRINGLLSRWLSRVITISHALQPKVAEAEGINPSKMVTIHYGLDGNAYASEGSTEPEGPLFDSSDSACLMGTVGRLVPVKGYDVLLEALSGVEGDFRLAILGDGPLRGELEERRDQLGLSEKVKFLGFTSRVSSILSGLDLFVLPTLGEGFGLVLLEAMAHRLPIISTDTMAVPEVVENQKTGLLVPPKDVKGMRDAIQILINDPEKRREMGQRGWEKLMSSFSVDQMVSKTRDLYLELLEEVGQKRTGLQAD